MIPRRLVLLLVAVGVALVALFFLLFERAQVEVAIGPKAIARHDPQLGAERFLREMGSEVHRDVDLLADLPLAGPLVLLGMEQMFTGAEFDALIEWMEEGGTVIAEAHPQFVDWIEVEMVTVEGSAHVLNIQGLDGEKFDVWMPASPRFGSIDGLEGVLEMAAGSALDVEVGEGRLILFARTDFSRNDHLADYDHAAFLWDLVQNDGAPDEVWLAVREAPRRLGTLVRERAWMVLLSMAALLGAWIWRSATRIGPILDYGSKPRRSLLEHIRASGDLLWRLGESERLLAGVRRAVRRRAMQRHPGWHSLSPREQVVEMASLSDVSGGLLDQALDAAGGSEPATFTRRVKTLDRVWRSL
ncbi:MAG: DUF4350 domain-containing protein [Thermoanaerobaculia bacterium]|nr:DUF4350 domain-containing protein [Thermoanaerobaculia bacterium]